MPGAFRKTLSERGQKVRFLWQHDRTEPIGKILELREDTRGLFIKAVISDTARGRDALALLRDNVGLGLSIGYDAMPGGTEYVKEADGSTSRLLKELRLWEASVVTFQMNEEATVTALKAAGPTEFKPYAAVRQGDVWRVYKLNPDGEPTGDALGEHETEDEANAQVRALYANEQEAGKGEAGGDEQKAVTKREGDGDHPAGHFLVVEDPEKPTTWHLRVRGPDGKLDHGLMGAAWAALHGGYRGNKYEGPGKAEALRKLRALYEGEDMETPKAGEGPAETGAVAPAETGAVAPDAEKEMTPEGPVRRLGDVLQGSIHQIFTQMADDWYTAGLLSREERIQLSNLIGDVLDGLTQGIPPVVAQRRLNGPVGFYMAGDGPGEEKAGRILAARNAARVRAAIDAAQAALAALEEVLEDAGIGEPAGEVPEETNGAAPAEKRAPDGARGQAAVPDDKQRAHEAGPDAIPAPPTSGRLLEDDRLRLLKRVQVARASLPLEV